MKAKLPLLPIKTALVACASKLLLLLSILLLPERAAQAQSLSFQANEEVDYELYYKWGLVFSKAGNATFKMKDTYFEGAPAWHYSLLFRSAGIVEKLYQMRDTMDGYYSKAPRLLYSTKHSDEGDYYSVDELRFHYEAVNQVTIASRRYTLKRVKIDTLLVTEAPVSDMLGGTLYLRALAAGTLRNGDNFPLTVAIGRDLVTMRFRYSGQRIVEHKGVKYRTRHFYIDIEDEAFEQPKEAAEVWIGDDANHIPVKVRAKLKLGAVEAYFKEGRNLRAPMDCRVVIP